MPTAWWSAALATIIANILRGKHKPSFTPHVDCGDHVVIVNADKVRFTGRKLEQKIYYKHTGYAGGLKEVTAGKVLEGRFPERMLEKAVERMIPRGPLGRDQMRALHLYNGTEHPHGGQNPRSPRRRGDEPQEQGGRIMADKKSLSDLGELTNPKPEEPLPKLRPTPKLRRAASAPRATDGRRGREEPVADHGASTQGPQIEAVLREQQLDKQGRAYATGRRKDAVARVWLKPGSGKIVVNGREQEVYFARPTLRLIINQVFDVTDRKGQYDVDATVKGGGLSGQAGAVRHGISTALTRYEPALRTTVKREGFLTRDPRVVERKKYGRAKARRSFQFSKR